MMLSVCPPRSHREDPGNPRLSGGDRGVIASMARTGEASIQLCSLLGQPRRRPSVVGPATPGCVIIVAAIRRAGVVAAARANATLLRGTMRVRFGDCVLDTDTRQLFVGGAEVHLQPKAFQFLDLLIRNRPRVVPKEEIHERLWSGTFVSDGTLTSLLAEVRDAIGDDARHPRFVRTSHRVGYAFSGS